MPLPLWTPEILRSLDFLRPHDTILDIWLGDGDASLFFLEQWLEVYATWVNIESYDLNSNLQDKITLKESFVTKLDFPDDMFDIVWASHILEHEINPGLAFQEIRRVLKNGGKCIICLPPYKTKIVWGHVNTGYTLWQMMYQLLLSRYNIQWWSFIKYGYNLCAIVEKDDSIKLPELRYDKGDIETLSWLFPFEAIQWFEWNIKSHNWIFPLPSELSLSPSIIYKIKKILWFSE